MSKETKNQKSSAIANIARGALCVILSVVFFIISIPLILFAYIVFLVSRLGKTLNKTGDNVGNFTEMFLQRNINFVQKICNTDYNNHCTTHCGHNPHCGVPPYNIWTHLAMLLVHIIAMPYFWIMKKHSITSEKGVLKNGETLRVAYVSVWGTPCGIATYNEELVPQLQNFAEVKVFAEYANGEKQQELSRDPEWVIRCWDRNEHPKSQLMRELVSYEPHIVHIGHEYGFFARAYMYTSLITWLCGKHIPVVTTFHSVYEHQDKAVTESSSPHIIVHTDAGKSCLMNKGIDSKKIHTIPHGTEILSGTQDSPELLPSMWNTWHTNHTIFHPGFMFSYKGHIRMLEIVAKLKEKYPDVHYIIQGSENPHTMREHDALYTQIIETADALGLSSNVTLNRGFVSKEVLLSFIRTTRVCVLPYQSHPEHEVRATSGIARVVAGTETPLVVSDAHLFDDLENIAIKCASDDAIYNAIDRIFDSNDIKQSQIQNRVKFLQSTSWKTIAQKTVNIYKKAMNQ